MTTTELRVAEVSNWRLYGANLQSDFPFRNRLVRWDAPADLTFRCSVGPLDAPDPAERVVWRSRASGPGTASTTLSAMEHTQCVRFADISSFRLDDRRIDCQVRHPDDAYLVEIQFLGLVLGLWLERRGVLTLHASAVDLGEHSVAFVGGKGAGKTTLAAAFLAANAKLVTDDLLAVEPGPGQVGCRAGYPQLRLGPSEAGAFAPHLTGLERNHPAFEKLRVPVGPSGFGSFSPAPPPLAGLYLLEPCDEGQEISISRVRMADATIELIRHSFVPDLVTALGLGPHRLRALAAVATQLPVFRLRHRHGFSHLASVRDAVVAHVAGIDPRAGVAALAP